MYIKTMESLLAVQKLQQETEKAQDSGNPVRLAKFEQSKEKEAIKNIKDSDSSDIGASEPTDASVDTDDASDDFPTFEDYTSWTGYQQELGQTEEFIQKPPIRVSLNDLSGLSLVGIEEGFGQYDQIPEHTKYLFSQMGKILGNTLYIATQYKQEFALNADKCFERLQECASQLKAFISTGQDRQVNITDKEGLMYLTMNGRYDPANLRMFIDLYKKLFTTMTERLVDEEAYFEEFAQKVGNSFKFLSVDPKAFNMSLSEPSQGNTYIFLSEDTVRQVRFCLMAPKIEEGNFTQALESMRNSKFSYGYPKTIKLPEVQVSAYELLELINSACKLSYELKQMSLQLNKTIDIDGSVSYLVKQLFLDIGPGSEFVSRRDELVLTYFLKSYWMFGVLFYAQINLSKFAQTVLQSATSLISQETSKFS